MAIEMTRSSARAAWTVGKHLMMHRLALVLSVALLTWAGCSVNPVSGEKELILISESQEIALGAEAAPQFEQEFGGEVPDAQLQAYIDEVGGRMAAVSERQMPYEFTLVNSDVPNAFALPGGKIFITAGLMELLGNERQLAGVLGHEVGHVAWKHNVKGLQRQMGAAVLADVAGQVVGDDKGQIAEAATQVAGNMVVMRYGRTAEYEADARGVAYLMEAGYNPWGMVEVLEVLNTLHEREPSSLEELFQTHPITSKRVEEAAAMVREQAPRADPDQPDPNAERFLRMRSRLKSIAD